MTLRNVLCLRGTRSARGSQHGSTAYRPAGHRPFLGVGPSAGDRKNAQLRGDPRRRVGQPPACRGFLLGSGLVGARPRQHQRYVSQRDSPGPQRSAFTARRPAAAWQVRLACPCVGRREHRERRRVGRPHGPRTGLPIRFGSVGGEDGHFRATGPRARSGGHAVDRGRTSAAR